MAAISLSINRGAFDFQPGSFTVGVLAPNANDIEFRFNTTDQSGNPSPSNVITRKDLHNALDAIKRALESNAFFITPAGL